MVTRQTSFRETEEFQRGRAGERLVADYLQRKGWYVIPSYDYSGEEEKAPRLEGLSEYHVVPDLDVSRDGERRWAEVKTKTAATFTHITQQLEHGVAKRHFENYQRVQEITGCPVYVFIYEEQSGALLVACLDSLAVHESRRESRMKKGGCRQEQMIYFARSAFTEVMPCGTEVTVGVRRADRRVT